MLKKKCSLCGGPLVNNRCTLCGLDNSGYDDKPKPRSASGRIAAHTSPAQKAPARRASVQEAAVRKEAGQKGTAQKTPAQASASPARPAAQASASGTVRRARQPGNPKTKSLAVWIIILAVILITAVQLLSDSDSALFSGVFSPDGSDSYSLDVSDSPDADYSYDDWGTGEYTYDPYANVTREIPADGETREVLLGNGIYKVGVHIPEGIYRAELAEGTGSLQIRDTENAIFYSVYFGTEEEYDEVTQTDDIRLYNGAELEIDSNVIVRLSTDNAQPLTQEPSANPLTEPVTVKEGTYIAGDGEIPEGIFDITAIDYTDGNSGYASITLVYPDGTSAYLWTDCASLALTTDGYTASGVKNVVIPEGTEISVEHGDVVFTPGEGYYDVDFAGYGRQYG